MSEVLSDAVPGISQDDPERHALRSYAVKLFEGDLGLGFVLALHFRDTGKLAALDIIRPTLGQKEPHAERREEPAVRKRQGHKGLAVGKLAECSAVLVCRADAVRAALWQRGVVDDQYGVLHAAQGPGSFEEHCFELSAVPGADGEEVMESLVGNADVLCDRFDAFAFEGSEEAAEVAWEAGTLLGVVQGFQTGSEEVGKGALPVAGNRHARQDRSEQDGAAESCPEVTKSC